MPDTPELPDEPIVDDTLMAVNVRRSPRYAVFCILGAILGIVVALILTFAFDGTTEESRNTGLIYSRSQVFAFLTLVGIVVGVVVGAAVALILDRVMSRRTHEQIADRERTRLMP